MPDPTCPHEDCTETVTHWHNVPDGKVFACPRTKGHEFCLLHVDPEIGCYAPRTKPAPLDAILAAADDAKRAHDRLCDLAETLVPESSPVKTAENPAPVWVPVEPGTVIKAGTHYQVEHVASFDRMVDDGAPIFIDPRTVPAVIEDPRVAVVEEWVTETLKGDREDAIRDLLARIDAARADQ